VGSGIAAAVIPSNLNRSENQNLFSFICGYFQEIQMNRQRIFSLFAITGLLLLNACFASPTTPTLTVTPGATTVAQTTRLPDSPTPTIVVTPTSSPTPIPEPTLPPPMLGWAWYQSVDGVYVIAYPQQWQVQNSGAGGIIFSSPDTGSQIRISRRTVPPASEAEGNAAALPDTPVATTTPAPPTCTDWLDTVKANRSSIPGIPTGLDVAFNATFGGQPAFFHFSPATGAGGGESALLLFCEASAIVSLYYQNATNTRLPDEAAIYLQMVASLIWRGRTAAPLDIPTAWATGETLVIHWPQLEPVPLSAEEQLFYQAGFVATVTEVDAGKFEVMTDEGEMLRIRGRSYTFSGGLSLGQKNSPSPTFPEPSDRVFLIGYPVTSSTGEPFFTAHYLAVERDGQWQTVGFQTTFDLAHESPDPNLFRQYPQDQPIRLRFIGTLTQLIPYLVDEAGNSLTEDMVSEIEATQQMIAEGILLTPENPQLRLDSLYVLVGECYPIADIELDCYPWQRLYPVTLPQ
jgi:hypothetical protein